MPRESALSLSDAQPLSLHKSNKVVVKVEPASSFTPSDQMLLPPEKADTNESIQMEPFDVEETSSYVNSCCEVEESSSNEPRKDLLLAENKADSPEQSIAKDDLLVEDIQDDDNDEDWLSMTSDVDGEIGIGDDSTDGVVLSESMEYITADDGSCEALDSMKSKTNDHTDLDKIGTLVVDTKKSECDEKASEKMTTCENVISAEVSNLVDNYSENREMESSNEGINLTIPQVEIQSSSDKDEDWKSVVSTVSQEDVNKHKEEEKVKALCESSANMRPQSRSDHTEESVDRPAKLQKTKTKKLGKKKKTTPGVSSTDGKASKAKKITPSQTK